MKQARIDGLSAAFDMLVATGAVVKVGDTLYRGSQIADIRGKLEAALRRDREITAAAFRDLIGTSRKYTIPLLESFDRDRLHRAQRRPSHAAGQAVSRRPRRAVG